MPGSRGSSPSLPTITSIMWKRGVGLRPSICEAIRACVWRLDCGTHLRDSEITGARGGLMTLLGTIAGYLIGRSSKVESE